MHEIKASESICISDKSLKRNFSRSTAVSTTNVVVVNIDEDSDQVEEVKVNSSVIEISAGQIPFLNIREEEEENKAFCITIDSSESPSP